MSVRRSRDAQISIHPQIVSGRECISGTRIPVFILAGRFIAGETVSSIAKDYDITVKAVEQAIRYELCKAKRLKRAKEMVRYDNF
jgi:uncharacterized protein (DUF433 family)